MSGSSIFSAEENELFEKYLALNLKHDASFYLMDDKKYPDSELNTFLSLMSKKYFEIVLGKHVKAIA